VPAVTAAVVLALAFSPTRAQEDEPRESGLIEETGARLVQIDATLTGPAEVLDSLTSEDFRLKVGLKWVTEFEVDKLCHDAPELDLAEVAEMDDEEILVRPRLAISFVFYFDQPHLTQTGRGRAMHLARELVDKLIVDGNRGMIVSGADKIKSYGDLTGDPITLLKAINTLEEDRDQWDTYASLEYRRLLDIMEEMPQTGSGTAGRVDLHRALNLARLYYSEELWRAERDNRRFSMVLGRIAGLDGPKVVIYFADNMRTRAGMHYLDLFGAAQKGRIIQEFGADGFDVNRYSSVSGSTLGALTTFDQVVDKASAYGIRLYTVQAEGLVMAGDQNVPTTNRVRDAQDTLRDFALETGGTAFLNGVRATKIAQQISNDLECLYIVSFDPEGFDHDRSLAVKLFVDQPEVKVKVRGRVVVQSESSRLTSELLAAYANPGAGEADVPVRATVIPTGYDDGIFHALVQVRLPGSQVPAATWDLGASVVSRGDARDTSGRLTVSAPDAPVILQTTMEFRPGPFEVVAVAHNITTDVVTSRQLEGEWPRPNAELASVGPIAVVQKTRGAILKNGKVRKSGIVAYAEDEPVDPEIAARLVATVCKSSDQKGKLRVSRVLLGQSEVSFPDLMIDLGKDQCALIQDVIPAGTMTSGVFRYQVRVLDRNDELAVAERKFAAWDGVPLETPL
jgi:hypothetical protein